MTEMRSSQDSQATPVLQDIIVEPESDQAYIPSPYIQKKSGAVMNNGHSEMYNRKKETS